MKEVEQISSGPDDWQMLSFLFDKWSHHDGLIYSRWRSFWTSQSILFGALAILFTSTQNPKYIIMGVLVLVGALLAFSWRSMVKIDRYVRNTFNREIVKHMRQFNLLENSESMWDDSNWSAKKDAHPVNLWHTPEPTAKGRRVRASAIVERSVLLLAILELLSGCVSIVYGIVGH